MGRLNVYRTIRTIEFGSIPETITKTFSFFISH